ncbi:MAG: hypothetical protein KKC76_21240, partial [Proteobacteria bacterium]|nr:hypothetical protein [Pseudomonadota bacterium]
SPLPLNSMREPKPCGIFRANRPPTVEGVEKTTVVTLMGVLLATVAGNLAAPCVAVLDAFFAAAPMFKIAKDTVLENGERLLHIITRAKDNAVACGHQARNKSGVSLTVIWYLLASWPWLSYLCFRHGKFRGITMTYFPQSFMLRCSRLRRWGLATGTDCKKHRCHNNRKKTFSNHVFPLLVSWLPRCKKSSLANIFYFTGMFIGKDMFWEIAGPKDVAWHGGGENLSACGRIGCCRVLEVISG